MKKQLLEKLKEIEKNIAESREIGAQKLEYLSEEVRKAFNQAFEALVSKTNFLKEIEINREKLKFWRIGVFKTIWPINLKYVLSMPFIYGIALPMALFHLFLEIYHQVCFRFYGIPLVDRKEFFIYDRQLLPYLNWLEKINCFYCSYANNLFRYAVEIGGRTERFWCPIKYHRRINNTHSQYTKFVDYLDGKNFREKWQDLRDFSDLDKDKKINK